MKGKYNTRLLNLFYIFFRNNWIYGKYSTHSDIRIIKILGYSNINNSNIYVQTLEKKERENRECKKQTDRYALLREINRPIKYIVYKIYLFAFENVIRVVFE